MSKLFKIFSLTFFLFSFFIVVPKRIEAATIAPDPIGDLDIQQPRKVKISGLGAGNKYLWKESKLTFAISPVGPFGYTAVFADCYAADSGGNLEYDLGPFSVPGVYKLELYTVNPATSGGCDSIRQAVKFPTSADPNRDNAGFSVGGFTRQRCCAPGEPVYDRNADACKRNLSPLAAATTPTQCKISGDHCEPESLSCFKTKSRVIAGKICSDDRNFVAANSDKYVFCAQAKGIPCDQNPNNPAIATAIGCVHTSPIGFAEDILKFLVAISGGIAFLMMLMGAFQMLTSAGNPETLKGGQDRLTSAIVGLLIVILAVILLRFIGVDILGILPK